jgi:GNAT superfamily N-acetyltransferase
MSNDLLKEKTAGEFLFSTNKQKLDLKYIHHYLSEQSYWAQNIPFAVFQKSVEHSLSFGVYHQNKQVGFARLITDYSTFAYLADVFIDENYRGKGLSKELMRFIFSLEFINGLRRMMLATLDAHGLYAQYGFKPMSNPDRFMEVHHPDVYKN